MSNPLGSVASPASPSPLRAALWVGGSMLPGAMAVQTVLESPETFAVVGSGRLWVGAVSLFGARIASDGEAATADVSLLAVLIVLGLAAVAAWALGAATIGIKRDWTWAQSLDAWGRAWKWWLLPGLWEMLRLAAFVTGLEKLQTFLESTPHLWIAAALAGWLATFLNLVRPETSESQRTRRPLRIAVAAAVVYAIVFTAMNWQLYRGLLIPHGDSAMYEEHLWNLLHGKGFRSYLDQGLFLGEHIQVIHALLIPLYVLWPSHLMLELSESVALASGAIPTFLLARRHTGSDRAALWLALAYLLAVPMQFLDIAIDLKTFRPTAFAIPLLLFALDQMERGRWKTMLALLAVTLSAQEDLALVIAPLGVWMTICLPPFGSGGRGGGVRAADWLRRWAVRVLKRTRSSADPVFPSPLPLSPAKPGERDSSGPLLSEGEAGGGRPQVASESPAPAPPSWLGPAIAVGATAYLLLALTVLIPHFRAGAEVHYTSYFGELGHSPGEIAKSLVTQPALFFGKLFSSRSLTYALLLVLPYGLMPLRSWGRLLVAAPLFAVLCLMDTSTVPEQAGALLVPFHHFHAPLVPILVWAAAAGLQCAQGAGATRAPSPSAPQAAARALWNARFAAGCAFATGLFYSLSPLGIPFWDAGSTWSWHALYVPGKRAEMFPRVLRQIPPTARVASTDFVHPRFTHFKRSYDYSGFRREASGYEDRVPEDTDYIVIDTRHRYSTIQNPGDLREFRDEPDQWELLPDSTEGYFIVLKRRGK